MPLPVLSAVKIAASVAKSAKKKKANTKNASHQSHGHGDG